jgi:asparagine synthase (glutamine-hydrolysing)
MVMAGASVEVVREAVANGDALPGCAGFAGELDAGTLVRDVLGRYPLFSEPDEPTTYSADPTDLAEPRRVPAGHRRDARGDTRIWSLPDPEPFGDDGRAVATVREAVRGSIAGVDGAPPVAFSGGVDSGLLAAHTDGPLVVGGFPDSDDVTAARSAAAALDRDLEVVEFTHEVLESAVPDVVAATGRSNPMDVGIALPLYLVARRVAAAGQDRLLLGQGADELFGGYAKVADAATDDRLAAETVRGATREVVRSLPDQLERDVLALRAAGVEPVVPFLQDRVVRAALRLPGRLLVAGDTRKVAFRRAATALPASIRSREKTAVQYGSDVARELDRLARQAGFKRRMDDHVGRWIDSLCK